MKVGKWELKKVTDERQVQEQRKIEASGFYVVYLGLAAAILVQLVFLRLPPEQIAGELAAILAGAVYKGVWSTYSRPTPKNYVRFSLLGGVFLPASTPIPGWG